MSRPRDQYGRFLPYQSSPAPSTTPIHSDVSQGFSAIVTVAHEVLETPDIALRTNRKLSEQMIRDPMVMGPLSKRMLATAQLDWQILPEDDNDEQQVEVAAQLDAILRMMPRKIDFFRDLLWATFRGTGVSEVYWAQDRFTDEWVIAKHRPHNGDKIVYDVHGEPRLRTRQQQIRGRELSPRERDRLIIHTYDPDDGSFYEPAEAGYVFQGRGLRDLIWQYWWLKHNALRFWLTLMERYGTGFMVGRYPMGNDAAKKAIKSVMRNLMSDSKVTLPVPAGAEERETYGLESQSFTGTAQHAQMFHEFVENWAGKHIRIAIEGQQHTYQESGDGLGSGRAKTMKEIFRMYRDYDAKAVAESVTDQLVSRLQLYNFGDLPFKCRFAFVLDNDYEESEQRVRAARENALIVPKSWPYEVLGIPQPKEDDEVVELGGGEELGEFEQGFGFGGELFRQSQAVRRYRRAIVDEVT